MAQRKPKRDDRLEVEVERVDERGLGVGRAQHEAGEFRVALRRALAGERVVAQVLRRRGEKIEGRLLEVLRASGERVSPPCRHYGACGGCALQDLRYAAQLAAKREIVERALRRERIEVAVEPVIGSANELHYRNKMDFTFGTRRWVEPGEAEGVQRDFAVGLHPREQFRKVLDVERCEIQPEPFDAILASARRLALEQRLVAWDLVRHEGLLRHIVLRRSVATGEILVQLTTSSESPEQVGPYVAALLAAHPQITTLVQAINSRGATVAMGERELVLHGSGAIRERLAGLWYRVSAASFFQTNTAQAERLVEVTLEEARLAGRERVLDLYCGAGTLTLPLARKATHVQGVELVEAAVEDARRNAEENGIANVTFSAGDVLAWFGSAGASECDVMVVDPPRAGLHPKVVELLARAAARRMVYMSCHIASAARDIAALAPAGWRATRARPVDLFPQTPHVECVLTLERAP
ncbi:MAG: 23S rRNA (uracil(1939)-C(5))-methyltransferase RlmD [Planctomycetes bacterium]|nr:23S rRNA (uracil(1939)-C(5))-methyltransferase RlmD [Planctomycetota bacterium]